METLAAIIGRRARRLVGCAEREDMQVTKSRFIPRRANGIILLIGAVATAGALGACQAAPDDGSEEHGAYGRIELALLGTAPSGTVYRLVTKFAIQGPLSATLDGSGDTASVSMEVPVGQYEVSLVDGWMLERGSPGGDFEEVEAQLLSANPRIVQVEGQSTSQVRFEFLVQDVPVSFGVGTLDIAFDVHESPSSFVVGEGGYVFSGPWRGYAFTDSDEATSTPADFDDHPAGAPLCIAGSVAYGSDFSGFALLGFALDQQRAPDTEPGAVLPTGSGIAYDITANVTSPLHLLILGPNGTTDPDDRWCATITAGSGVVPWSSFNTTCWDPAEGAWYSGEPLVEATVLVPAGITAVPFDFCLNSLGPAD